MNRRRFLAITLASGGIVLTGCVEAGDDTRESSDGKTQNAVTSSCDPGQALTLCLESIDEAVSPLSFDVDVINDQLTETDVPVLEIRVANTGTETATWTQAMDEFAFPARTTEPGYLAIGLEEEIEMQAVDGGECVRVERGIGRDDVAITTELAPGDSLEQRYGIAGDERGLDGRQCPPDETYRTEYRYGDHGTWGFEFTLQ